MLLDEETLQHVARNGEMDYTKWPSIIEPLLDRLNQIVTDEFPIPRPFPNLNPQANLPPTQIHPDASTETQQTDVTSTPSQSQAQPTTPTRSLPPVPLFPASSATHVTESTSPSQEPDPDTTLSDDHPSSPTQPTSFSHLPPPLLQLLTSITTTLRSSFLSRPPHTIQRLSELILSPRQHYKSLPAWLRAVDRVVNVSSPADIFPLAEGGYHNNILTNGDAGGGILWKNEEVRNGTAGTTAAGGLGELGSDESLGGALLTPIPWLRNGHLNDSEASDTQSLDKDSADDNLGDEIPHTGSGVGEGGDIDTPPSTTSPIEATSAAAALATTSHHDNDLVPSRSDGAVTQGELMRLEQEAGVIPASQTVPPRGMERDEALLDDDDEEGDGGETVPHARGPDVVGAVDMGKVAGREVQVRISRDRGYGEGLKEAQDVLEGGNEAKRDSAGGGGSEEDFEMVQRADEMDVDIDDHVDAREEKRDEDMVLVDADGKMDDEEKMGDEGETRSDPVVK